MTPITPSYIKALREKITQGEWSVEDPLEGHLAIVQAGLETWQWEWIADVPTRPERGAKISRLQAEANAQAIALVPDLLDDHASLTTENERLRMEITRLKGETP